ncbi:hypothetical protein BXT84_01825 [Sulfobacillus thermotolerans]|uniref:Uncharacterized protein n=1 Tax=Sulfobacillus thermotolerans TaxID=338644 RepID=A0ABN5GWG7_9FIRM|nr:hypothetical protein BXT84_01825 [Sulfobacillus thermotolerans]
MANRRRQAAIAVAVLGLAMGVVAKGMHRVQFWKMSDQARIVWQAPFGTGETHLGVARGLDGQQYGPLAFAYAHKNFWIADSYRNRIIESTDPWKTVSVPGTIIDELVFVRRALYFVDNQQLAVYRLADQHITKVIQLQAPKGQTEAIWHLAADGGDLLLEGVRLGHGESVMWLAKYSAQGRQIAMLNLAKSAWDSPLQVQPTYPVTAVVRSFEPGPSGGLYVEAASSDRYQRMVWVYSRHNHLVRKVPIVSPEPIVHSELLGVNRWGWIYMGLNLNVSGRALVEVVQPGGESTTLKVHAVPIKSVVYGTVGPTGALYLLQSTANEYRIARWGLTPQTHWVWHMPHL